jgi:hypothetical protein
MYITGISLRGRLHVRFGIRISFRFACKSDGDMILCPISRPTPIDSYPSRLRNYWQIKKIGKGAKFRETDSRANNRATAGNRVGNRTENWMLQN